MHAVIFFIVCILIFIAISFLGDNYLKINNNTPVVSPTKPANACNLDAKICPDGTSVVRVGPGCEFSPCPTNPPVNTDWKIYTNNQYGFQFKYPSSSISKPGPTAKGITSHFFLGNNIEIIIRDPKIPEADVLKNWPSYTEKKVNGLKAYKYVTKSSSIGGNPPNLTFVQTMITLPTVNVFINFFETNQGEYIKFESQFNQILSSFQLVAKDKYVCPENGWINCMPILTDEVKKSCTKEAIDWYKTNCNSFKGVAQ